MMDWTTYFDSVIDSTTLLIAVLGILVVCTEMPFTSVLFSEGRGFSSHEQRETATANNTGIMNKIFFICMNRFNKLSPN